MKFLDYIALYIHLIKYNIKAQLRYKTSFILSVLTECCFLLAKSLYIIIIFKAGVPIYGLTPEQMLLFIGSYTLITGFMDAFFFPNISSIPSYVQNGDLDLYITKPLNSLFFISFQKFDLGLGVPNVLGGLTMIIVSWKLCSVPLTLGNILGYIFLTVLGIALTYPILLIPTLCSFWIIKSNSLMDTVWALWDFNNMPMHIYSRAIQLIGTFIFPIFIITNFAPLFVFNKLPLLSVFSAVVILIVFYAVAFVMWGYALKRYSSVSS